MIHNLTRGLGLLEEAEFKQRQEAEQMVKTIGDFGDALRKIEAIHDETWNKENFNVELTRALTAIENARMEWNTARLKLPALSPEALKQTEEKTAPTPAASPLANLSFGELCKIGLAMTWPLVLVALAALGIFIAILARH